MFYESLCCPGDTNAPTHHMEEIHATQDKVRPEVRAYRLQHRSVRRGRLSLPNRPRLKEDTPGMGY